MRKIAAPTLCRWRSSLIVFFGVTAGCVAPPAPYEEYTLARSAVKAAQEVDSARFSTGLYNRAQDAYRNGKKAYDEAEFDRAKVLFNQAVAFAERAENSTRLKKFQSGDSFP